MRAVNLYDSGKVTKVEEWGENYTAVVLGTQAYRVSVPAQNYKQGSCTCYLGQNDKLCKHIVALALYAVMDRQPLKDKDKEFSHLIKPGKRRDLLSKEELAALKKSITASMRYIKPYSGPSRTWFANQDSLHEGCNRLSAIVSNLPVNKQMAEVLVKLLLRLDKKLRVSGVDDSNGTVGSFMSEVVQMLIEYARIDSKCIDAFELLVGRETCFDWEEPLVRILDEGFQYL